MECKDNQDLPKNCRAFVVLLCVGQQIIALPSQGPSHEGILFLHGTAKHMKSRRMKEFFCYTGQPNTWRAVAWRHSFVTRDSQTHEEPSHEGILLLHGTAKHMKSRRMKAFFCYTGQPNTWRAVAWRHSFVTWNSQTHEEPSHEGILL